MKTADWYARLDYGGFDILLPQRDVLSGSFACSLTELSLDGAVGSLLGGNRRAARPKSLLSLADGTVLSTGADFALAELPGGSFAPPCPLLAEHLARQGITAFRFEGTKIQYVLDARQFIQVWKEKDDTCPPC